MLCVRTTENSGDRAESDQSSCLLGTSLGVRLLVGSYRTTGIKDCVLWECGLQDPGRLLTRADAYHGPGIG